jgi:hypothetical protein
VVFIKKIFFSKMQQEVINISDDDDVQLISSNKIDLSSNCEIIKENKIKPKTLCYGMLRCPVVVLHQPDKSLMVVKMSLFAVPDSNWYRFAFCSHENAQVLIF